MSIIPYHGPKSFTYRNILESGWYLHSDDRHRWQLYQFDASEPDPLFRWRTETGHACVAEQPNFFEDSDEFIGPIVLPK